MTAQSKDSLPFEAPLRELKARVDELAVQAAGNPALEGPLASLRRQYADYERQVYDNLKPWDTVLVARKGDRPQTRDYLKSAFDRFEELHGDRVYGDDGAIVGGLAEINGRRVAVVGQHRGRDVGERHRCNAGCPHPEGYRKAARIMRLAEKFGLPLVCLVDTKGAYPGIGSEERGVAVAIAENLRGLSCLKTAVVCVIIGEGGSGGALGLGVGDRVLMLQHAYYSVISPEGCASILWRDGAKKADAAEVLRLTSRDLLSLGVIDQGVPEPVGGAHQHPQEAARLLREALAASLEALDGRSGEELARERFRKFRRMGQWREGAAEE
jgi:acetyl-CoA carboxylase carboxyl transferase subunit alpha